MTVATPGENAIKADHNASVLIIPSRVAQCKCAVLANQSVAVRAIRVEHVYVAVCSRPMLYCYIAILLATTHEIDSYNGHNMKSSCCDTQVE